MDATASIAGILQITITLVDYLKAATQASSDRRKLLLEANSLVALLKSLQEFLSIEDPDDFPDWRRAVCQLETSQGPFEQYRDGLESVLRKALPQGRFERAAQTVAWRWTKGDVNETLQRIDRMKMLISIALEMDHTHV